MKMVVLFTFSLSLVLLLIEPASCKRHRKLHEEEEVLKSDQKNKDVVTYLPGQPDVEFRHYAGGYVTFNETNERALFYWFYEATNHPHQKPLVLWLNGGPGCSSVGYGAAQEIGPFLLDTNGQALKFNNYSWNREANMLFLESPVGVGFSYSNTPSDYDNGRDDFAANDAYIFLHKWFLKFPSYKACTFYIAGESYAGRYVPELAEIIYDKNKDPSFHIDLKGILLGNPETTDAEEWRGIVDYAWSHAVISDETHKMIKENCDFLSSNPWSDKVCGQALDELYNQYGEIDMYSLYTSVCNLGDSASSEDYSMKSMTKMRKSKMMPRMMGSHFPCLDEYAKTYYNRPDVQKALHANDGLHLKNWSICNMTLYDGWDYSAPPVLPIYKKHITGGFKIWIYSGDTDGRIPVLSTRYSLASLDLPIKKSWRPWYHEKQVSGWYQEYEGLTFRGAGHAVPCFKPSSSLAFFSSFLNAQSPPSSR